MKTSDPFGVVFTPIEIKALQEGERAFWRPVPVLHPRDKFVRNGGLLPATALQKRLWAFKPWDANAPKNLDGKGDPLPSYVLRCPYGERGQILYVKEETRIWHRSMSHDSIVEYRVDKAEVVVKSGGCVRGPNIIMTLGSPLMDYEQGHSRWRSAARMPEAASRFRLRVKNIRLFHLREEGWMWYVEFSKMKSPN